MKLHGTPQIQPLGGPPPVLRVEGRIESTVALSIGQELRAIVERVLPDGKALLNFGAFSLLARSTLPLVEGGQLQLTLQKLGPVVELRVIPEPVIPDAEAALRAMAAVLRDRAAAPATLPSPAATGLPKDVTHPEWMKGIEVLARSVRVLIGSEEGDHPGPRLAGEVSRAAESSGLFLESTVVRMARELHAAATRLSTNVENQLALMKSLLRAVPPADLAAAAATGGVKPEQMLASIARISPEVIDASLELLLAPSKQLGREVAMEKALDLISAALKRSPDEEPLPPPVERQLTDARRVLDEIRNLSGALRGRIELLSSRLEADQKAALARMIGAALEAGRPDAAARATKAMQVIEGFQGASLAHPPAAAAGGGEAFLLIPIPVSSGARTDVVELKVFYRERDGRPQFDATNMRVSVLLRLDHLGRVRADAHLTAGAARCAFTLENARAHEYMMSRIGELREALEEAGFGNAIVSASVDPKRIDEFHETRTEPGGPQRVLDVNA